MKKKDRHLHPYGRFALYLLLGGFIGGLLGGVLAVIKNDIVQFFAGSQWRGAMTFVQHILYPYGYVWICLITMGISYFFTRKMEKQYSALSSEADYEEFEPLEHSCNKILLFNNVMMHIIICLTMIVYISPSDLTSSSSVVYTLLMTISIVWIKVTTRKTVMTMFRFEPKRKVDICAKGFAKDWLTQCDEQEKMEIFRCGYYTWEKMMYLLAGAMGLTAFSGIYFDTGYYPFLLVMMISLFHHGCYYYEHVKGVRDER